MADSTLKLTYFDGKGRAEVARLILAAAGKEYEDIRFSDEDWPKYKPRAPFGQAPYLEVDRQVYAQSLAINAFLAREFGFYGKTNLEGLGIDQVVQLVEDLFRVTSKNFHIEDEAEREKATVKQREEISPRFLGYLEQLLKENGTGYFVGERITLADISVFDLITGFQEKFVNFDDSYPLLQKNVEIVKSHDKIGPYVATRGPSDF